MSINDLSVKIIHLYFVNYLKYVVNCLEYRTITVVHVEFVRQLSKN